MALYVKDPGARVEYQVDWALPAGAAGLAASEWRVEPAEADGVELVSAARVERTTAATVGGGIAGRVYRVTNRVSMTDGRAEERSLTLRVEER